MAKVVFIYLFLGVRLFQSAAHTLATKSMFHYIDAAHSLALFFACSYDMAVAQLQAGFSYSRSSWPLACCSAWFSLWAESSSHSCPRTKHFHPRQIIMFSDLECDYVNPIDLCNKLNQVRIVFPGMRDAH